MSSFNGKCICFMLLHVFFIVYHSIWGTWFLEWSIFLLNFFIEIAMVIIDVIIIIKIGIYFSPAIKWFLLLTLLQIEILFLAARVSLFAIINCVFILKGCRHWLILLILNFLNLFLFGGFNLDTGRC